MILEDYLKKIEGLNKEYISQYRNEDACKDEEEYHREMDNILLDIIEELGYEEIADKYKEARKWFWYA
jgi:hypothetical protein